MRKSIIAAGLLLSASVLSVSCSGFLDENPTTSLSEASVYGSEDALEAQIAGVLSKFYGSYMMQGYMNEYLHTASGLLMWKGQRKNDNWTDGLKLTKYSTSSPNQSWYGQLYSAINACNRLLDNLPASPVDSDFKKEIEGEALFYRSVLYFYLVRMYGDVPLILTCPKTIEETNNPRTAWYKVYCQIIKDLDTAESSMRDYASAEALAPGQGRPCRWAATAMKSSVYLTVASILTSFEADPEDQFFDISKDAALVAEGKLPRTPDFSPAGISSAKDAWKLCYNTAEKVITEGPYSLAPDYRLLFRWTEPEDFLLRERIFVLQTTNQGTSENRLAKMSLPIFPYGSSNYTTPNNNPGRFRPSRFLFQKFAADNGGKLGDESKGTGNIYVSCADPRFDASFIHTSWIRLDTGKKLVMYPSQGTIRSSDGTNCMPYFKKYLDPSYDATAGAADFYLMRLAEIYLNSAEAAANLSQAPGDDFWAKALSRVEDLHRRARQSTDSGEPALFPSWADRVFEDRQELVNAIVWERAYEMCGEGHEYFDTHRYGAKWLAKVIAEPLNGFLALPEQGPGDDPDKEPGIFRYNYVENIYPTDPAELRKSLLCAFPTNTEGTFNTAIDITSDQNDFFWQ